MGVMLRPDEDPMPSEEEPARLAGLVPGDIDRKHLEELRRNLDEELRDEKLALMEESPYTFFRATNHLYWSQLARDTRLSRYGGM